MRRRLPFKEVLNRKMKELGIGAVEMSQHAAEKGVPLKVTTIKKALAETKNPGFYTVAAIAIGMGIPPLVFMAECLGESTDQPLLKQGQFKNLENIYKSLTPAGQQKADPFVGGLELQLKHIKNQSK